MRGEKSQSCLQVDVQASPGSLPGLLLTVAVIPLHLCARDSWNGGMEMMTCYFLILLTCSVHNGNNWK